jgi:orotidine-5'-phosphate decarboxylase
VSIPPSAPGFARARERLIFALDLPTLDQAEEAVDALAGEVGVFKVGLELFVKAGPAAATRAARYGHPVFLDLKLHDIEATVEGAVGSAAALGVRYLTLHAGGGPGMIERAVRRAEAESPELRILAVTVLTSLTQADLHAVGISASPAEQVLLLARRAVECGVHGLVCSAEEVAQLRLALGPTPILVTPGIRPTGANSQDQKRTSTPGAAIEGGASLLVVGRPIRDAKDRVQAARAIVSEIEAAL